MSERLNKFLSTNLGVSRREADDLISSGTVSINGKPATIGDKIQPDSKITINGNPVKITQHIYIMLNKPVGYVSSRRHQDLTPTLYDLLPPEYRTLKTVGRLDKSSSGLILLTNDGDFTFQMTHPKFAKTKEYIVKLDRPLAPLHQQMIADIGVQLTDGTSQLGLTALSQDRKQWQVTMREGRNRQIRRSFGALGYTVIKLHRQVFGKYQLGTLKSGEYKLISK